MIENHTPQNYESRYEATPLSNGDAIDMHMANPDLLGHDEARLLGAAAELAMKQRREEQQAQIEQTPQAFTRHVGLLLENYRDSERAA